MDVSSEDGETFSSDHTAGQVANTLIRASKDFIHEDGPQWAAAIAYYSLLSIFPLLLATVSIAAFFVDPDWVINQITELLGQYLPQGETRIEEIVQSAFDARGGVSVISILLLLWSGTRVFGVLAKALNTAFDQSDHYGFLKKRLVELIMVLTLGLLFIIAMVSRFAIRFILNRVGNLPEEQNVLFILLQIVVPALLLFVVFFLVYRFVPNRRVSGKAALAGAVFATLVVLVARPLFLGYLNRFAEYNLIYGSLAILVILVIWTWIMAMIILLGGQLTSAVQKRHDANQRQERSDSPS